MEKWKTQEAAFPTFPQGLPRERKQGPPEQAGSKVALSRAHHSQTGRTVRP